ncbi:hypothetical protein QWJ26_39515 [Streptomyces sp. CSDS2]|uniref:hypothetical protein n=1 Tax=Streptomyces sp. CSDS2 TaxID=3055051 RepID=UPI0025AED022|nr:hypothetical protein [Streptomyces sp. CSDS2]MDN3265782.1 hypothetical protein [Streptomyces sp. CSDS2]
MAVLFVDGDSPGTTCSDIRANTRWFTMGCEVYRCYNAKADNKLSVSEEEQLQAVEDGIEVTESE